MSYVLGFSYGGIPLLYINSVSYLLLSNKVLQNLLAENKNHLFICDSTVWGNLLLNLCGLIHEAAVI